MQLSLHSYTYQKEYCNLSHLLKHYLDFAFLCCIPRFSTVKLISNPFTFSRILNNPLKLPIPIFIVHSQVFTPHLTEQQDNSLFFEILSSLGY